jgi:Baseplate J-like protein
MDKQLIAELCGCCEPPTTPTPVLIANRPGLTAIAYRVGTFAAFREAMLEAIARQPALRGLTTRQSDDPAITLLELWAAVADVLTFYQERIANEAFLRTALERDSVLRLVRLLDYHLRPGLAATTQLAFTVDDGATVRIPVGLRVMSTPGQDERPQTFETVEAITADARLSRVPVLPQPIAINPFAQGRQTAFLTSDNAGWQAAKSLNPTDKVVLFGGAGASSSGSAAASSRTYGATIGWGVPPRVAAAPMMWGPQANVGEELAFWASFSQPTLAVSVGAGADPNAPEEKEIKEVRVEGDRFLLVWTSPIIKDVWASDAKARVFTQKMRVFGHDAPASFAKAVLGETAEGSTTVTWSSVQIPPSALAVTGATLPLNAVYKDLVVGDELLIYERNASSQVVTITGLSDGEEILGADSLVTGAVADQRHRATVTRATVSPDVSIANRRDVNIYVLKSSEIPLWTGDFSDLITAGRLCLPAVKLDAAGDTVEIGRTISGRELKSGVAIRLTDIDLGRSVLLDDHTRRPIGAIITARSVLPFEGQDFLVIDVASPSAIQLETRTAVMLGNVAQATHGETVRDEILGDGDASMPFQRFSLRKKPLTYVPSARSVRGESSLRVLINGVKWAEVSSLYGQPPTAQVYTARQADDGTTVLQFGDAGTGARLPSGRGNVVATYRQGAGLEGRLKADQLNILLDRPVGLKAGTNPAATEGGSDPESLDQARQTAPTTVKTFGRAISLLDFESLATASGEVAKAKATWVWRGVEKAVHLTVAGQQGGIFSPEVLGRLHSGLTQQRDPNHALLLANFCRVPLVVTADLRVDDRYIREDVRQAAQQALLAYFAFERVGFAQPIHLSDIYRVLQEVAGVVSVDINTLHFKGYDGWTADQLAARGATNEPVQGHLRLFAARPRPGPTSPVDPAVIACFGSNPLPAVLPAEQAYIQTEASDVALTATGGLE